MAIHKTVMVTHDGVWRIAADPAGTRFIVEKDGQYVVTCLSLTELEEFLAVFFVRLSDLEEG